MTSFSRLVGGADAERPDYDVARVPAPPRTAGRARDLFGFPRGARAGRCLHGIFELVDFTADTTWTPIVRRMLATHGFAREWEPVLLDMVARVVATSLDESGAVRLDRVPLAARLNELEFHHPIARLDGAALVRLLAEHPLGPAPVREAAARSQIAGAGGFMKGFIDLVCACDGRYWLVDYKSTWLGDTLDDYDADRLAQAIAADTFWLQYLIYTLVVHRLLRRRLPGYDYDRHVGGVRYLFVRGMDPGRGLATGVYRDRPSKALVEALDALVTPAARAGEVP
jgi:exodeoxyribonuclease V beta subunit